MDSRLAFVIAQYKGAVTEAIKLLGEAGIERPNSSIVWALNGVENSGTLNNDASFRKHGYGICVTMGGIDVDFDFGPKGEIQAPDSFRLATFIEGREERFGFKSVQEMERLYEAAS